MPSEGRVALLATADAASDAAEASALASVARIVEHAPVFGASRRIIGPLLQRGVWPSLAELSSHAGVRCEPDERSRRRRGPRRRSDLYDARITELGALPTRPDNWHDLFNVVTWAAFPNAKRALHARQYRRLCERVPELFERLPGARTGEQNALTQLDEGGLLLCISDGAADVGESLLTRLRELSTAREPLTNAHLASFGARARVFGHALHEHLVLDAPTPRAAVLLLPCLPEALDATLAALLDDDGAPFLGMAASAWLTPELDTSS